MLLTAPTFVDPQHEHTARAQPGMNNKMCALYVKADPPSSNGTFFYSFGMDGMKVTHFSLLRCMGKGAQGEEGGREEGGGGGVKGGGGGGGGGGGKGGGGGGS